MRTTLNSKIITVHPPAFMGICQYFNALMLVFISLFFFFTPGVTVVHELSDPHIRSARHPLNRLGNFTGLCRQNLSSGPKNGSSPRVLLNFLRSNISGTEWPLFGSVFYLWATESLQDAWEKDPSSNVVAPNVYAKGAIEAATRLVINPNAGKLGQNPLG